MLKLLFGLATFFSFVCAAIAGSMDSWHNISANANSKYLISNDKVVAIRNISLGCDSGLNDTFHGIGRVVDVKYRDSSLVVTGVVAEFVGGSREYIAVDSLQDVAPEIDQLDLNWVSQGMSEMFLSKKSLSFGVFLCGAAGKIIVLNDVSYAN